MCGVAVVGLLIAAVVVLPDRGPDHPDAWDERVADLALFVERERDLEFEHPVRVEFLSEREYSEATRIDGGLLTDEDRAMIEDSTAILEAFGLVPTGTDLLDTTNEMADAGTLAFYDPTTETVTVRGTELTPVVEATVVHELTHVAQDQAFDLERTLDAESSGAHDGFRALVEGDAMRIEMSYVESLPSAEEDAYWDEYLGELGDAEAGLEAIPSSLQAMFAAPYVLGDPLVALIAADGGNAAVDEAFEAPPASSEHLLDPGSFFAGDAPADVDEPELPGGARRIGQPDALGAVGLFVMLGERIDPVVALAAADGWGGDAYVAYRDGDRTCARVDLVADTPADLDEMAAALADWVAAGPAGAASVVVAGETVTLEACAAPAGAADPGREPGGDAFALAAVRAQVAAMGATEIGLDRDEALALGSCFVDRISFDTLVEANASAEPSPGVAEAVDDALAGCIAAA